MNLISAASGDATVLWRNAEAPPRRSLPTRRAMTTTDLTIEKIITFLLETPMFERLDAVELTEVLRILQIRRLRDREALFREGEEGDGWYVVYEGEAVVTRGLEGGGDRVLAILGPHACFGEMAILDGSPRSATIVSRGAGTFFKFPREHFSLLLQEENLAAYKLVLEMSKVVCARQREVTRQVSRLLAERVLSEGRVRDSLGPLVDNSAHNQ